MSSLKSCGFIIHPLSPTPSSVLKSKNSFFVSSYSFKVSLKGRRGFLKFLGGTAAGVVALKTGLAKILGKASGAVSKKVIDEVIIDSGSGAPAWLQPLVNKALREGTDKTKNLAYKDAQTVKSLDTPTGKVDVYYDVRTGEVEIDESYFDQ